MFKRWEVLDQAKALAFEQREADRCGKCGQQRAEWHDENGKELRDPPFDLKLTSCPACEMIALEDEDHQRKPWEGYAFARPPASSPAADDVSTVTG